MGGKKPILRRTHVCNNTDLLQSLCYKFAILCQIREYPKPFINQFSVQRALTQPSTMTTQLGAASTTMDPASANCVVTAFAVGDWGKPLDMGGSSISNYDLHSQRIVAELMNIQACVDPCLCGVLSHGDNLYWDGIYGLSTRDDRFKKSFEDIYNGTCIKFKPWFSTFGNHDCGGGNSLCSATDKPAQCNGKAEMLQGLDNKFLGQSSYVSPNNNRWQLDDHFYSRRIEDPVTGVSIEIFNVDMNDAAIAGAHSVCCQCYGYAKDDNSGCNQIRRGDPYCCGGDTDMYDACMAKIDQWAEESRTLLIKHAKASNATFKCVNSHYSFLSHYTEEASRRYMKVLEGLGISLFIYGHTHSGQHLHLESQYLHMVENGVGGGMKSELPSAIPPFATDMAKSIWRSDGKDYMFVSLSASREFLKVQFYGVDSNWIFARNWEDTTIGGVAVKHCWYIPKDGSKGMAC